MGDKMTANEALERITARVNEAKARFVGLGVKVNTETEYMNSLFKSTDNPARAKFMSVSLIISADGLCDDDIYYLSLSCEVKGKKVDEAMLEKSEAEFEKYLNDTVTRLAEGDPKAVLEALSKEANAEWEEVLGKLQKSQKRATLINIIGGALIVVGIAVLILVAVL